MAGSKHAILFVTPFDLDTAAVNWATGRHGFGHVALWSGIVARAQPMVLDASTRRDVHGDPIGVSIRPLREMTGDAPYVTLELDDSLGEWMFHRALRCIGTSYDFGGLLKSRQLTDAYTCSGLICCALPPQLAKRCRPPLGPTSPNDIARALGVPKWSTP